MCDSAYHLEARRKARVLQRKQEYLNSLASIPQQQETLSAIETRPPLEPLNDQRSLKLDSGYRSSMHARGLWGMDMNKPPKDSYRRLSVQKSRGELPSLHPAWPLVNRDLQQRAKVLRNHFMYMGPKLAFAHLYEVPKIARSISEDWTEQYDISKKFGESYAKINNRNEESINRYWPLE